MGGYRRVMLSRVTDVVRVLLEMQNDGRLYDGVM